MRKESDYNPGGRRSGEELGRVKRQKTIIRIHHRRKISIFHSRRKISFAVLSFC